MEGMRISDIEREAVMRRLREAVAEGRLDPEELEERVAKALAARTEADLEPLTRDLPALPQRRPRTALSETMRRRIAGALTADLICIGVWAASGTDGSFWPIWVIFGTSVGMIGPAVHRLLGVERQETSSSRSDGV